MKLNAAGVGLRIRQARVAKGWTQGHLAQVLGVRRSSVVRWETGVSVPSRLGIPKLAKVLEQEPEWLLAKADEGQTETAAGERAENKELKRLRAEIRRLEKEREKHLAALASPRASQLPAPHLQTAPVTPPARPDFKDAPVLKDVLERWNSANTESRLLAALLITGDWSYKLKLWNRNVALDEEVLRAVGLVHRNTGAHGA